MARLIQWTQHKIYDIELTFSWNMETWKYPIEDNKENGWGWQQNIYLEFYSESNERKKVCIVGRHLLHITTIFLDTFYQINIFLSDSNIICSIKIGTEFKSEQTNSADTCTLCGAFFLHCCTWTIHLIPVMSQQPTLH